MPGEPAAPPPWDRHRYEELCLRARGTSVNDRTLLATDYLNCINEICMMLEMLPDMPDCFEDCKSWQLLSYEDHFRQSHIADASLALEAYPLSPPESRRAFDKLVANMAGIIQGTIDALDHAMHSERPEEISLITKTAVGSLHDNINMLGAVINGQTHDQEIIDRLMKT